MALTSSTLPTLLPGDRSGEMKRPMCRLSLSLTAVLIGCSAAPPRSPWDWVGKSEAAVRAAYAATASELGVIYWGGSGRRRIYFALRDATQVWFELDWGGTVEMAGGPEPKARWTRHDRDSISVEGVW
jgi:hypothetical protein